jgi:hypothetical protein
MYSSVGGGGMMASQAKHVNKSRQAPIGNNNMH